jgi:hypothetical protein
MRLLKYTSVALAVPLLLAPAADASVPRAALARTAARPAVSPPLSFPNDILPVLARAGCAQSVCHAKQGGKNGFQLSVLSFDPEADYHAVVRAAEGRRIDLQDPTRSLLLLKPGMALPHGGGMRLRPGSPEYRLLARWISEGAPYGPPGDRRLLRVQVQPGDRTLAPGARQPLRATAFYSDRTRRDVTRLADYRSNESGVAEVDEGGLVRSTGTPGEAAVMVRFMGQVAVCRVTVPQKTPVSRQAYARLPRLNFIDELVYRKLAKLNLLPSAPCDDATFLRRASLDLTGTLPTAEEARQFLAAAGRERAAVKVQVARQGPKTKHLSTSRACTAPAPRGANEGPRPLQGSERSGGSGKTHPTSLVRAQLIDRLLSRPGYADYWAMRWVNLLLVDRDPLFPKGAFAYDRWVRDAFRDNMPFDRFARAIVTATGETYRDGPANFYRALATPGEQAKSISQLFLGVRLDCAQCHHHPNERWSVEDFYSLAAYFARVKRKGGAEFENVIFVGSEGEVNHPKTGAVMEPRPLGAPAPKLDPDADRREALAAWMTAPENPFFARAAVNRVWAMLMGRGLVDPDDDFRASNPASNPELLDVLARDFVAHGYDVKHLIRTIAGSAAYQRSSRVTPNNARDLRNYSRYLVKRMPAEVLLDAVSQVTGVPEVFQGHPVGTHAAQMWDNKLPVEFLEVFGRPSRLSVCECDRPADGSVPQVLHLMNGASVQARLTSDKGTSAALEKGQKAPGEIIEELYLAAYSRRPRPAEISAARKAFDRPNATRRQAIEDLMWALLNSPEFLFNH